MIPVISQGGVTYDTPLQRYIFASWSCATHELYEATKPWGRGSIFFPTIWPVAGDEQSRSVRHQYPSKFISADGKTLYLQSNVCCGGDSYTFLAAQAIFGNLQCLLSLECSLEYESGEGARHAEPSARARISARFAR